MIGEHGRHLRLTRPGPAHQGPSRLFGTASTLVCDLGSWSPKARLNGNANKASTLATLIQTGQEGKRVLSDG